MLTGRSLRRLRVLSGFAAFGLAVLCASACMPEPDLVTGLAGQGAPPQAEFGTGPSAELPGSIARELRVMTWNVQWLGAPDFGPSDDVLQLARAQEVLMLVRADLIALQEVATQTSAQALADALPGYALVLSSYAQRQQVALLYGRERFSPPAIDYVASAGDAGRPPLVLQLRSRDGRELLLVVVHAKAGEQPSSHAQRSQLGLDLAAYLARERRGRDVIVIGDFNAELSEQHAHARSAYAALLDGGAYVAPTAELDRGTTAWGARLDHIIISYELLERLATGSIRVAESESLDRHPDFFDTVSDHLPVVLDLQPAFSSP